MIENKEQKIISSARSVFLRYGFKRVTMHDIAEAAGMSRPAIYLVFPNKEEVFKAVIRKMMSDSIDEIRQGLSQIKSADKKLEYAFELWTVRPFDLVRTSPDAKELIYCGYEFAGDVHKEMGEAFEGLLVTIVKPMIKPAKQLKLSAANVAHILRSAVRGFKETSEDSVELRQIIKNFLSIIIPAVSA